MEPQVEQGSRRKKGLFRKLAHAAESATDVISRTAASAQEVINDSDLRKKAGGKIVMGIQGIGSTADAVRRQVLQNVNEGLSTGARGAQGAIERVQLQLQQQRATRALAHARNAPVDIQIGFHVFLQVPQEMRSRLWVVLLEDPSLAVPFQEMGRFPDSGSFDMDAVSGATVSPPPSRGHSAAVSHAATPSGSPTASGRHGRVAPESFRFVTQPAAPAVLPAGDGVGMSGEADSAAAAAEQPLGGVLQDSDDAADISDSCSDEANASAAATAPLLAASTAVVRGGEVVEGGQHSTGGRGDEEADWEVVNKVDTLHPSSYVGPARLSAHLDDSVGTGAADSTRSATQAALARHGSAAPAGRSPGPRGRGGEPSGAPVATGDNRPSSQGTCGRVLRDAERRRLEAQEALALRMKVSEDRIKDAMIGAEWPLSATTGAGGTAARKFGAEAARFDTLLQVTVGQEEIEDHIRRDIHRTFPEHPRFALGQGQRELFNVLKAYSLADMEVGYCQGMAFLAGVILMYLPERLAYALFARLMAPPPRGAGLRRLYLEGLGELKAAMAMFDWLLARHKPRLAAHLNSHGVPSVLYLCQWLLTAFACPFPPYFAAQLVDVMLLENSDRIIMQMAMAVMAEAEEKLLGISDFESLIACLKSEPANWSDSKLRGLLTAAYLSSVSEEELALAAAAVAPAGEAGEAGAGAGTAATAAAAGGVGAAQQGHVRVSTTTVDEPVLQRELELLSLAGFAGAQCNDDGDAVAAAATAGDGVGASGEAPAVELSPAARAASLSSPAGLLSASQRRRLSVGPGGPAL